MRIIDSDFYYDYSTVPDTSPWTQAEFTAQSGHVVSVSGGALAGDSGSAHAAISWRHTAHPVMTKGEIFAQNGALAGSAGEFFVGVLDDDGNGYLLNNNGNLRFRAYKFTAGVLAQIGTTLQWRRNYAPGDTLSLRFEVVEGEMRLEFCLNGNAFITHTDNSSPHLADLRPEWRVSTTAKIAAIGVHNKVIKPTYEYFEAGLSTADYAEGSIKDNITRAATYSPFESINELEHTSWLTEYGDCVTDVSVAARSPDGSTIQIPTGVYRLTADVPDLRVAQQTVTFSGTTSEWQEAVAPLAMDITPAQGGEVVIGAAQVVADSAAASVRMGIADGYSAAGVVPSLFGTATPYYLAPNVPNSPNVKMTIRRQVWPSDASDKWDFVDFIEPIKFFG